MLVKICRQQNTVSSGQIYAGLRAPQTPRARLAAWAASQNYVLLFQPAAFIPASAGQYSQTAVIFFYRANLSLPTFSNIHFYKSSTLKPLSCSPATSHKKTEPSAQFFPLYISSIFPGLYNPQFSSCSTKPKCLRMPATVSYTHLTLPTILRV